MSNEKSNDTIGNRYRDLPVCSAVPQPLRYYDSDYYSLLQYTVLLLGGYLSTFQNTVLLRPLHIKGSTIVLNAGTRWYPKYSGLVPPSIKKLWQREAPVPKAQTVNCDVLRRLRKNVQSSRPELWR
jgi:hypothetical protein